MLAGPHRLGVRWHDADRPIGLQYGRPDVFHILDAVDFHENVLVRQFTVHNERANEREVRLFLHNDFHISETEVGDTAYFDPATRALIHYKGPRWFLINASGQTGAAGLAQYAVGRKETVAMQGTWRDGRAQLPIQEDETALVLWALWHHFDKFHDLEFIKPLYRPLIIRAAEWMCAFRQKSGLPEESYEKLSGFNRCPSCGRSLHERDRPGHVSERLAVTS